MTTLRCFSSETSRQAQILRHDGDPASVDGVAVGIVEKTHQVSLGGLLQRQQGGALESKILVGLLGYLANQVLKGELWDEQVR